MRNRFRSVPRCANDQFMKPIQTRHDIAAQHGEDVADSAIQRLECPLEKPMNNAPWPCGHFARRNKTTRLLVVGLALAAAAMTGMPGAELTPFNGSDLSGWRKPTGTWQAAGGAVPVPDDPKKLSVTPGSGVLVNGETGRTSNLLTEQEHGDVEAHIEFVVPKGSNSGVYFQGRYEIQVLDSWGVEQLKHGDCGGIYQRYDEKEKRGFEGHPPRVNASKPPGEWQTFEVIFRAPRFDAAGKKLANARFIKVIHNGQVVHENVDVTGPTRSAAFSDEKPAGPRMLQGDHGPVAYRNLRLKPIKLP